jgi:hypothetical protein
MTADPHRPPRFWRWLLGRLLPECDREFVIGDLDEEFARLATSVARNRWYRSQAIRSLLATMRTRLPFDDGTNQHGKGRRRIMDRFIADVRYAFRSLGRSRALAFLIIGTLGVGAGATIAIFTVANEVLFSALTYEDPDELVMLWESNRENGWNQVHAAPANVADWRERVAAFEDVAHFYDSSRGTALVQEGGAYNVSVASVSGNFFTIAHPPFDLAFGTDLANRKACRPAAQSRRAGVRRDLRRGAGTPPAARSEAARSRIDDAVQGEPHERAHGAAEAVAQGHPGTCAESRSDRRQADV